MGTYQMGVAVRDARNDVVEATIGTAAKLKFFSGALPANCAAADPAGLLATLTLPSNWMADSSAGVKALAGAWSGTGSGAGTIACFRIYDNGVTTCHEQGDVTATGGGGAMTVDNTNIAIGQTINVTSYTRTEGNA